MKLVWRKWDGLILIFIEEPIEKTVTYSLADDAVTRIGMAFEGTKLPAFADKGLSA
jgi:hypothetical protein